MAYIEGTPLSELIRGNVVAQRTAADLVRKVALALQEAHDRGLIHRDLKPANIMLNRRREPIVMDFGLARRTRADEARLTDSGSLLGTPGYLPPEQVEGNQEWAPTGDIYSLGVVLDELLTGRLPYEGSVTAVLAQILTHDPPPPSRHRPDLDPALETICLKAMHPPDLGYAAAKYRLDGKATVFKSGIAICDSSGGAFSPVVFEVLGDSKVLWQSTPTQQPKECQQCAVKLDGVAILELRVHARGSHHSAHAAWLEPRVLLKDDNSTPK